uniref:Putative ovule protein n=1 Tax=Solanum chacoense TaxID=4108 RepID=A0A0V0HXZ8_SOLCH
MSDLADFKYHPMCKAAKLTHLIFADDLMVFCKGDTNSIKRVMEALKHFSAVTGLEANLQKSDIFLARMTEEAKLRILNSTGFPMGVLPIRYLGLPLSSKKWNKVDCYQLVEKITKRITSGYSRQLSYAGRLQIVNVVLFSIYNFWGTVFILPQSVLQEVDKKMQRIPMGKLGRAQENSIGGMG